MVVGKNFLVFVCFRGHFTLFFLHESSSWVKIRLHAENQLPGYRGSGLKVGGCITDQLHCHSNLSCVGLSWAVTKITKMHLAAITICARSCAMLLENVQNWSSRFTWPLLILTFSLSIHL